MAWRVNLTTPDIERVADGAVPAPSFFERLQLPTLSPTGQCVSALRFGDPRVQALFGALCHFSHLHSGFRNRDLRPLVAAVHARELASYTAGAMTYDLRRLRLRGVMKRAPRTLRYTLTAGGMRAVFLYTRLCRRLRRPHGSDRADPQFSSRLDAALHQLDRALQEPWSSPNRAA